MDMWIIWLIVAAALVVVEVLSQMVWTLCLAVGCAGAVVADVCGASVPWQVATLALTAVVAYIVLMPLFKRWHDRSSAAGSSGALTGMDALPGRRARVTVGIEPGGLGRVRIDGDSWQARAPRCDALIGPGAEVSVTAYDGNILDVETV